MSRGKIDSLSSKAYNDSQNPEIDNMKFDSKRIGASNEGIERKKPHFYARYLKNKSGSVSMSRDPSSLTDREARKKFFSLVCNYEGLNEVKLCDLSKNELRFRMLDWIEENNTIVRIKDDARQFLPYRFEYPDVIKLYLYKLFYPRIFDFELLSEDEYKYIKFRSPYIEENFLTLFQQIELLCLTVIYDGIIIAIESFLSKQIDSLKQYNGEIDTSDSVSDMKEFIENECDSSNDPRIKLIKLLIPSTIFFAKYHRRMYESRVVFEKKIVTILKHKTFYSGTRTDDSRYALIEAYAASTSLLDNITLPMERLLNLYYINKRSCIFDLSIMSENIEFMPHTLNGIATKYHIHNMIKDNSNKIEKKIADARGLSSVYNNPNCIIRNLFSRDYEVIDFLITQTANSIYSYYLMTKNEDVPPARCLDLLNLINKDGFSLKIDQSIILNKITDINNVDYARILDLKGGGVTAL